MQYDVFICHASEDKEDFVRPLAEMLRHHHVDVWYDEFSLKIGDSLSQKIDEGLSKSNFGIVVLSHNFFKKPWAKRELMGLTSREMVEGKDLIIPIWHRIDIQDVLRFSPPLADKKAGSSSDGINALIRDLIKKIKPDESPLVSARDHLENLNVDTPPISDEWWLDIIEYKESLKYPDLNAERRWIFPLPFPEEDHGLNRGLNIANAALQLDWSFEAEELNISPITHPDVVHEFIRRWPGLYDCARKNAGVLAMYAPQLTIPGFDLGFEDVFDRLLEPGNNDADRILTYGRHDTVDKNPPLCGDIIALRHETFGNYTPAELGYWYFQAHDACYFRSNLTVFSGLVWLLSSDSSWLPEKCRETLIHGICKRDIWFSSMFIYNNAFIDRLLEDNRSQFSLSGNVLDGLKELINVTINDLGINQNTDAIMERIIEIGLIDLYYDYNEHMQSRRAIRENKT